MAKQFGDGNIGDFYQRPGRLDPSKSMTPRGDMGFQTPTNVGNNWSTPSTNSSGGGVPGGAYYGRPNENGPTLSPNLLGRYAPTERFNFFQVIGNNTATTAGWVSITCERPTLLVPTGQLFGSVYFAPHNIPTTFGSGSALLNAERAEGPGVVYLWAPGTWWLKYNAASTNIATFRQMSAEDPAIVAAAMSMPGAQRISTTEINTGVANTQTNLLAANAARRAAVIQLKSAPGANPLYIALNGNASSTVNSMALTSQWQTVTFSDEAMNIGIIQCITAGANYLVQVTEYE